MPENECWKTENKSFFWQFEKMFLKNEFCRIMLFCRILQNKNVFKEKYWPV